jgi:DNA polymerase-3 subunit epsilon
MPLIRFTSKGDAWNFLWEKVRDNDLCPKLSGLQVAKGLCFDYQTGECRGACMGIETIKKYNKRVNKAIQSFREDGETVAILGQGRDYGEQSVVLVEKGSYLGFGFINQDVTISDFETAKTHIRFSVETPTVQNLINSYLTNPRGAELIMF